MMNKDMFSVVGKTAIVTGASSGLGAAFAQILASRGANVVLTARRTERLEELADRITQDGGTVLPIPCDVADSAQVSDMVGRAWNHFGRVDVLVANVGSAADFGAGPERLPEAAFSQVIQVNLTGVWLCYREVGARMLRDGKRGEVQSQVEAHQAKMDTTTEGILEFLKTHKGWQKRVAIRDAVGGRLKTVVEALDEAVKVKAVERKVTGARGQAMVYRYRPIPAGSTGKKAKF
jgi:NAD(P)-dependent dehydrogenase (short-subunit alcohol dehydrogenase family)